jgi:phosphomannomutase
LEDRLRISISGIRGKVPQALNVEIASMFASAFSSYLEKGTMVLCSLCTEPVMRIIIEGKEEKLINSIYSEIKEHL